MSKGEIFVQYLKIAIAIIALLVFAGFGGEVIHILKNIEYQLMLI